MIQVRTPDGHIAQFPDGTSPQTIQAAMTAHFGGPNAGQARAYLAAQANLARNNAATGDVGRTVRAAGQGLLGGFGDELNGLAAAGLTGGQNFLSGVTGGAVPKAPYSMGDAYHGTVEAVRDDMAAYHNRHPVMDTAAQVGGALATPGAGEAAAFIGRGAGLGQAALRSAAVSAGMGALNGAGNATGGLPSRVMPAVQGAITGAATGAVVPVAAAGAGKVWNGVQGMANNAGRAMGVVPPAKTAAARLAEWIQADQGLQPAQSFAGVSQPTIADLGGENVRAGIRNAGTVGPARQQLQAYAQGVGANLQDHQVAVANRLTPGNPQTGVQLASNLSAARTAADSVNYPQFQQTPVPVNQGVLSAVSGDTGASGLAYAAKVADAQRDPGALADIASLAAARDPLMYNLPAQPVGAGSLDLVRRGLRDNATAAFKSGEGSIGSGVSDRAKDLAAVLRDVPGFSQAVDTHADLSNQIDAIDHGATGLRAPAPTFAEGLSGMNDAATSASGVGFRDALVDALTRPKEGAIGVGNRLSGSSQIGANLTAQYGQEAADAIQRGLGAETDRMANAQWMAPAGGAKTFSSAQDAAHGGGHGFNPLALVGKGIDMVRHGPPLSDAERSSIVDMGLGTDPDAFLMQALAKSGAALPQPPGYLSLGGGQALAKYLQSQPAQ